MSDISELLERFCRGPELLAALADLAEAARNTCDARQHPPLTEALHEADAAIARATGAA